jgi:uncharacterized protein YoxC
MLCNKIFSKVSATLFFGVVITLTLIIFKVSTFEESEAMNHTMQNIEESTNEIVQNKSQSTNNTGEAILPQQNATDIIQNKSQSTNNTGEAILPQQNATDLGSNLTEVAKKLAKSIDDGLKNLSNKSNL